MITVRPLKTAALLACALALAACQTTSSRIAELEDFAAKQHPPRAVPRDASTPLAVSIPGLNIPFAPVGSAQFGRLNEMLAQDAVPSFTIGYDDKIHPLTAVADLYSSEYSIAATRILPALSSAVEEENGIRKAQGVPPLAELDIIAYSQGSVLALDFIRNLITFRRDHDTLRKKAGAEWDFFILDPELSNLVSTLDDFLLVRNMRVQREKQWDTDYDFQRFYKRTHAKMQKAFRRFQTYLTNPGKLYPGVAVFSGSQAGYPRKYPHILEALREQYPSKEAAGSIPLEFWLEYAAYDTFLPLNVRLFSIAGSFFGSRNADLLYNLLNLLPGRADRFIVGPAKQQIKETRLGNRYHLEVIKELLRYFKRVGVRREFENTYFMVGVFGEEGDGMVGQSSAHFSSHLFTQITPESLLSHSQDAPIRRPFDQLPTFPVTALRVKHLPQTHLFIFKTHGAAEMFPHSPVYPFLLAFLKKDYKKLEELHNERRHRLRAFMVELTLPEAPSGGPAVDEFRGSRFLLKSASRDIRIKGEFFNKDSRTFVWLGSFRAKKNFFDFKRETPPPQGTVILRMERAGSKPVDIELTVEPGVNHFVEITPHPDDGLKGLQLAEAEKVYDWVQGEPLAA